MDAFHLQTSAFKSGTRSGSGATARSVSRSAKTGETQVTAKKASSGAVKKAAVKRAYKKPAAGLGTERPDLVVSDDSETVQVEIKMKAGSGELVIRVMSAGDGDWEPVTDEALRGGMELLLQRESLLERTAARFGMAAEALLRSLEESAVNVSDASGGIPDAEREALLAAGITLDGAEDDPTGAGEVVKGLARFAQFRDDALTATEAAKVIGLTPGRIRQLVGAGTLVTIPNGEAGYLLPAWQFFNGRHVPGLELVLDAVGEVHPLTLAGFMTRPDVDLEIEGRAVSPVEWLLSGGDPRPVADLAAGLSILV